MPRMKKDTPAKPTKNKGAQRPLADEVEAVVASLKRLATRKTRDGMARARYATASARAFAHPRWPNVDAGD